MFDRGNVTGLIRYALPHGFGIAKSLSNEQTFQGFLDLLLSSACCIYWPPTVPGSQVPGTCATTRVSGI
jgi:hypothetical protein